MKLTTGIPFAGNSSPELSLPRREVAPVVSEPTDPAEQLSLLAAERRRLEEDAQALQEREENLRQYEARLRTMQSEMDSRTGNAGRSGAPFPARSSTNPFPNDAQLDAAWQKLHRARELCEAEQAHLRDDRIAMHAFDLELKQREEMLAAREARVAEQERLLATASPAPATEAATSGDEESTSVFKRFTRAPFQLAESVLGKKEKSEKPEEKPAES